MFEALRRETPANKGASAAGQEIFQRQMQLLVKKVNKKFHLFLVPDP